jgi:two-component system NarL family sensor kinase
VADGRIHTPALGLAPTAPSVRAARRRKVSSVVLHEIQEVIDGLVEQVALIGCDGTILAVNERWRRQVERQARTGLHISRDYISFLEELVESGDDGARPILQAFKDISAGTRQSFRCVYKGTGAFSGYDFNLIVAALTVNRTRHVLVSVHDVTELVKLKRQRRRIGSEVLQAQESERRRMARELHDSTAQLLVSLQLDLANLGRNSTGQDVEALIAECKKTVREVQQEVRTLSYIAHPPPLRDSSLGLALESLATGFAARTGLQIDIDVAGVGEASASVEAAVYRLAQEALANIYRHAGAKRATVRLVGREHYLHLMISDDGIGFDAADRHLRQAMGVGVIGMKERVRELGGRISIHRVPKGTAVTVSLPRRKRLALAPLIGAV